MLQKAVVGDEEKRLLRMLLLDVIGFEKGKPQENVYFF